MFLGLVIQDWFIAGIAKLPSDAFNTVIDLITRMKFAWFFGMVLSLMFVMMLALIVTHRLVGPIRRVERSFG